MLARPAPLRRVRQLVAHSHDLHGAVALMAQKIRRGRPRPGMYVESVDWTGVFTDIPVKWRATGCFELDDHGDLVIKTLYRKQHAEVGDKIVRNPGSKDFVAVARAVYNDKYEDEDE